MTGHADPTHERWDELAAGYALDALEPSEEAELLAHLDGCAVCQEGLRGHEFVAAQLAALAEDADLAPPSWTTIRAGVVGTLPASGQASGPIVLAEHAARRRRPPRLLAAAAAAVVLVAGGVIAWQLSGASPTAQEQAISACRSSAVCHVVGLQRGSRQRAVVLVRGDTARLLATDLSAPGADKVYALWQLPRDGRPTLLAEPVDTNRPSSAQLALPYGNTAAFALSVEPAGSVATTPTTVVAVGTAV